jgi:hypothetical protein
VQNKLISILFFSSIRFRSTSFRPLAPARIPVTPVRTAATADIVRRKAGSAGFVSSNRARLSQMEGARR